MAGIEIDAGGIDDYDVRLARFAAQMVDLRPFWPKLRGLFIDWMAEMFDTEGAPLVSGGHWAALSPRYAARKEKLRPGRGILYFDGDLRQAASRPESDAQPMELTLRINDPKIQWHQEGTRTMPARPLIPNVRLPDAWQRDLEREAADYVQEVARREFG